MTRPAAALACLVAALALAVWTPAASANITQPDGTVIPAAGGAGVTPYFAANGDGSINAVAEAATMPETYLPDCELSFTLIVHGADYDDEFGWYNVADGRPPTAAELNRMIQGSQPVGTRTVIDMALWSGGPIGFYMRDNTQGYTYYSQRAYNPDNTMSRGYIHMLTWNSHAVASAYYFGWEDLYGAAGNDNDFNDMLVFVSGLTCSGGGAPCTVPHAVGACATGVQQCRAGTLGCVAATTPSPEVCDGIDNDCNGTTDEGASLCPGGQVCQHAQCVPRCVEGGCFEGQVCVVDGGACIETACLAVTCPAGQRCIGGMCKAPCQGVTCPTGQTCRNGDCVDACAGITCDADAVCVAGICQPVCSCRPCGSNQTCGPAGICVETDCVGITCPAGQYCARGGCLDACDGATCPMGQHCVAGACVDAGGADAGPGLRDAARPTDARADAGHTGSAGSLGCGCAVALGEGGSSRGAGLALAAWAAAVVRRRRRARRA